MTRYNYKDEKGHYAVMPGNMCRKGLHEMTPENSYLHHYASHRQKKPTLVCKACRLDNERKRNERSLCKNGHPLTEGNYEWEQQGRRRIRICLACKKIKDNPDLCPHGHDLTVKENLIDDEYGGRRCKLCREGDPSLPFSVSPKSEKIECPAKCKKCGVTGRHSFYHDMSDDLETYRCRLCGTEHYAYDIPAIRLAERSKHSS